MQTALDDGGVVEQETPTARSTAQAFVPVPSWNALRMMFGSFGTDR